MGEFTASRTDGLILGTDSSTIFSVQFQPNSDNILSLYLFNLVVHFHYLTDNKADAMTAIDRWIVRTGTTRRFSGVV